MTVNTSPEIHQLVICANIFVKRGDKLLMMRRFSEKSFLPDYVHPIGGKVELNEDPLSAAKRELLEEAQIQVQNIKLKAIVTEIKSKKDDLYKTNWQVFHFVGEYNQGKIGETDEGELLWFTKDQLKQEKITDAIRLIIDFIFEENSNVVFLKNVYGEKNLILENKIEVL